MPLKKKYCIFKIQIYLYNIYMNTKNIKVGKIVYVYKDNELYKKARVLNINRSNECVVVMYLDDLFNDLYEDTVNIMNIRLYEGEKR